MQIHIWTPAGELLIVNNLNSWDCVTLLQSCIAKETGILPEHQRLLFGGRQLEGGRALLEYGIHQQCERIITIQMEEIEVVCLRASYEELVLASTLEAGSSQCNQCEHLFTNHASSETSTRAPSECTSDAGDVDACGASVLTSAACATTHTVYDAFIEANEAHTAYLLMRHRRLEAAGLGVRDLVGDRFCR